MVEEIDFDFGHFRKFEGPVTLTLTSDDLESHIVAHVVAAVAPPAPAVPAPQAPPLVVMRQESWSWYASHVVSGVNTLV